MIIVISDASSLILLEKIDLLEKLIKNNLKFIIPNEVKEEAITKGKEIKYPDAFKLEKKFIENLITVKTVKDIEFVNRIIKDFNVGKGEAEAIVLFLQEKGDLLSTDDRLAIGVCKSFKIPFVNTLDLIMRAFDKKIISKIETKEMINILAIEGRYRDEMIFNAIKKLGGK